MALTKIDDRGLNTPVDFLDDEKVRFGTGNDLEIYHNGTNTYIENDTGILFVRGDSLKLTSADGENYLIGTKDGSCELYHDNTLKFNTSSSGASVSGTLTSEHTSGNIGYTLHANGNSLGSQIKLHNDHGVAYVGQAGDTTGNLLVWNESNTDIKIAANNTERLRITAAGDVWLPVDSDKLIFGAGSDLEIYHDGTRNLIDSQGTQLRIETDALRLRSDGGETYAEADVNGAFKIYYDNTLQFQTLSNGVRLMNGHLQMNQTDAMKIIMGASDDFQLKHDGDWNYIQSYNSKNLAIQVKDTENAIVAIPDGEVQLYYNNGKTLETTANGITVFDDGKNDEARLIIQGGEGESATLYWYADDGDDNADKWRFSAGAGGTLNLQNYASGSWENNIECNGNGNAELYYDNVRKFRTTAEGAMVDGSFYIADSSHLILNDTNRAKFGNGGDLQIYHDGSHSYIDNTNGTGNIYIKDEVVRVRSATSFAVDNADGTETALMATLNGAVELYYNGSKKLETTNAGILLGGSLYANDNTKLILGTGEDLKISHDGTNSWIDNTAGNLILRDNTGDLYLQAPLVSLQGGTSESNKQTAKFTAGGSVELYHNDTKKFETTADGVYVTAAELKLQNQSAASSLIQVIGGEGGHATVELISDEGDDDADKWKIQADNNHSFYLQNKTSGGWETNIMATGNGGVYLNYDNTPKLQTTSAGGTLTGTWTGVGKILQVVSATSASDDSTNDDWNGSANSNAGTGTALGPTVSITPSSTSSKIIVIWSGGVFLTGGSNSNKIGILGLFNDTSDTQLVTARVGAQLSTSGDDWGQALTMVGYDSPNSTSAQTYTLVAGRYSGTYANTIYTNYGMPNDGNDKSVITAMEVA